MILPPGIKLTLPLDQLREGLTAGIMSLEQLDTFVISGSATKEGHFITKDNRVIFIGGPGSGGGVVGTPTSLRTAYFDEAAERAVVLEPAPHNPQMTIPKANVTREQVARFHERRTAVQRALQHRYADGQTAVAVIDAAIEQGLNQIKVTNRWTTLSTATGEDALRFASTVERDYIDVALNRGKFKRNYP